MQHPTLENLAMIDCSPRMDDLPLFNELPLNSSHPKYCSWGVWGAENDLGCLNHLTPSRTVAAAREVKSGTSVGLSWRMNEMRIPPPFRIAFEHNISAFNHHINEDEVRFNTQTSSQWDGFRHWGYEDGRLYNGVLQSEIRGGQTVRLGIHEWAARGIVGRGVLIDYCAYAEESGLEYDPWSFQSITVSTIHEIARKCNIQFQAGDILFLRTGFITRYEGTPDEEIKGKTDTKYPGLHGSVESLEWLWNTRFAAVAADSPSFEAWDAQAGSGETAAGHFRMHEHILAGLGMPIGELFDLERLAEQCKAEQRWTFFVTSQPLNIVGGVASPPNAIAIF